MLLTLVTGPGSEPVTLTEAKTHLRVSGTDDDTYITALIIVARQRAENYTRRSLIDQTWRLRLDTFAHGTRAHGIELPRSPVSALTAFNYIDTAGDSQAVGASVYTLEADASPAWIHLAYNQVWPTHRVEPLPVTIEYTAGYGSAASDVPEVFMHAIKLYISHMYENREPVVVGASVAQMPESIASLLLPYQQPLF